MRCWGDEGDTMRRQSKWKRPKRCQMTSLALLVSFFSCFLTLLLTKLFRYQLNLLMTMMMTGWWSWPAPTTTTTPHHTHNHCCKQLLVVWARQKDGTGQWDEMTGWWDETMRWDNGTGQWDGTMRWQDNGTTRWDDRTTRQDDRTMRLDDDTTYPPPSLQMWGGFLI